MQIFIFKEEDKKDLAEVFSVRNIVFVQGQGVPQDLEMDGKDEYCTHILIKEDGVAAATARIRKVDDRYKLERCAVLEKFRGKGFGEKLIEEALSLVPENCIIYLHAQVPVIGFYEKYGFVCIGEHFEEAGIQHCTMQLSTISTSK